MKHLPEKATIEIFRDCLKLASYMGGNRAKILFIRQMVMKDFRKNMYKTDPEEIDKLRFLAIKGISNFTIMSIKSDFLKTGEYKPESIYQADADED